MNYTEEVQRAIDFARVAHGTQTRKDGIRPYVDGHIIPVVDLVLQHSNNETLAIVAALHDTVEDTSITTIDIYNEFDEVVQEYVHHLTDRYTKENYPELNRAKRKQAERERYGDMPDDVKLIKLADVVANLRDDNGDAGFMQMYVREKLLCLPYLKVEHPLFDLATATAKEKAAKYGIKVDSL